MIKNMILLLILKRLTNILLITYVISTIFTVKSTFCGVSENHITLESRSFPKNLKEDGFWAAIYAARDGKVYIGLNTEGGGSAQFYIYDPVEDKIRHRADISEILGEKGKGRRTHAKIHTKFCEDNKGRIYFATGNMGAGPSEVDPRSWGGGHWCRYNPRADILEDLGLILPYSGVYGLTIDTSRMRLYGTAANGHFLIYDIEKGKMIDKGRINYHARSVARTIVTDDKGNVYGTYLPDKIFKYDPQSERLYDLAIQIPSTSRAFHRTHSIYKRYMRAGIWDNMNKKIYGVEGATSNLFEYHPYIGREGKVKKLAQLLPENETKIHKLAHYATLSFTMGKDRKIYYLPIVPMESDKENVGIDFFQMCGQAFLISYDLDSYEKKDMGRVYVEDGNRVIDFLNRAPSGGGATGIDGTIYFCGYVEENDPHQVARTFGKIPARLRLLIYRPYLAE
jgi:hypothetical protein